MGVSLNREPLLRTVKKSGWYASYCNAFLLPPANEVWGKVIFSQACVKNFVHRGGAWSGGAAWSRGGAWFRGVPGSRGCLVLGAVPGPGGPGPGCVWGGIPQGRLLLRAVRILLECILVLTVFVCRHYLYILPGLRSPRCHSTFHPGPATCSSNLFAPGESENITNTEEINFHDGEILWRVWEKIHSVCVSVWVVLLFSVLVQGLTKVSDQSRALEDRNDSNNSLEVCTPNSFIHLFFNSPDMDVVDMHNILIIPSDSVLWEKTMEASYLVGSFPCQFD